MPEYLAPGVYVEGSGRRGPPRSRASRRAPRASWAWRSGAPRRSCALTAPRRSSAATGVRAPARRTSTTVIPRLLRECGRAAYVARVPEPGAVALIAGIDPRSGGRPPTASPCSVVPRRGRLRAGGGGRDGRAMRAAAGPHCRPLDPAGPGPRRTALRRRTARSRWPTTRGSRSPIPGAGRERCRRPATSPGSSPGPTGSGASTPRLPACRCATPPGSWPGPRPATRRRSPPAGSTRSSHARVRWSGARGRPRSIRSGST